MTFKSWVELKVNGIECKPLPYHNNDVHVYLPCECWYKYQRLSTCKMKQKFWNLLFLSIQWGPYFTLSFILFYVFVTKETRRYKSSKSCFIIIIIYTYIFFILKGRDTFILKTKVPLFTRGRGFLMTPGTDSHEPWYITSRFWTLLTKLGILGYFIHFFILKTKMNVSIL